MQHRIPLFYEALLRAGLYEGVLHGLTIANVDSIQRQACLAAKTRWKFLTTERRISREKRAYLKQSRAIIPAASAEDARQLLWSTTADSFDIRYVSLSTFLFRLLQTSSEDPHQFLVGQVINVVVLPGVVGLGACHQRDPLV
jgi:hypothetical protein